MILTGLMQRGSVSKKRSPGGCCLLQLLTLTIYVHSYFPLLIHLMHIIYMINHQSDNVDEIENAVEQNQLA